jgi:hypothetical protein
MKESTIILLSIVLFSCNHQSDRKYKNTVSDTISIDNQGENHKTILNNTFNSTSELLPVPKFDSFISFCETFGGSYLPKTYLYKPQEKGYFGAHHLYDREKHVQMGFLIAHNPVDKFSDWRFTDTTQVFIALVMKRGYSRLKLFDKISLHDRKEVLIDFLGNPQIENDSMIVYWDKQRTIGQFKIKNGRITEYNYGRYNDSIKLPLTQIELDKINVW